MGACAFAVSAMAPASAAPRPKETPVKKHQPGERTAQTRPGKASGGGVGPASLEWAISTVLRP